MTGPTTFSASPQPSLQMSRTLWHRDARWSSQRLCDKAINTSMHAYAAMCLASVMLI